MIIKIFFVVLFMLILSYFMQFLGLAPISLVVLCLIFYLLLGIPLAHLVRALMRRKAPRRVTDSLVLIIVFIAAVLTMSASSITSDTIDSGIFKPKGIVDIGTVFMISTLVVIEVVVSMLIVDAFWLLISLVCRKFFPKSKLWSAGTRF